ncbi:uncharacterized protein LOC118445478 [Vespa mandarinia]|uniref:uncharacterized protein LOC118445478 n=1 Tax=Vespa mandarinia TaxID=7446 RepID=UPI001609683B|nr:uncharacterized protein LOC118445478 [Vespa mandarinia]
MAVESASSSSSTVQFALGNEVSPHCHFFKSSFARSLVRNVRDSKSLDYELHDNGTIVEETSAECNADNRNNNFFSLLDFRYDKTITTASTMTTMNSSSRRNNNERDTKVAICNASVPIESDQSNVDMNELERLRKECQSLKEDNRKLQNALALNQVPHVQVIDNVFLQTQIETLQWQLKQIESNKQMYRSLMEEVARFLDRAHKSLIILHEKNNSKDKNNARVPRSRSVHAVDTTTTTDCSPNRGNSTNSSSSSGSSRFTRAKSVNQISGGSAFREFTWSVLRRNQNTCTDNSNIPSCREQSYQDEKKMADGVTYTKPKQMELNPDDVPPEKLSQEAFRLMRTVQSLLAMREPDLSRISPFEDSGISPSPTNNHHHHHHHHHHHLRQDSSLSQRDNFVSTSMVQEDNYGNCIGDSEQDRENEEQERELVNDSNCLQFDSRDICQLKLTTCNTGIRTSVDATSYNSASSKTTEEEEQIIVTNRDNTLETREHVCKNNGNVTSTPMKCTKRLEKKGGINNNGISDLMVRNVRTKLANSVSSAEDESGFSSMSSFQEVGLPTSPITPIKGCHTEVGLPEIPIQKVPRRRWSSTANEIQALIKRHSSAANFPTAQTNSESLSVWV